MDIVNPKVLSQSELLVAVAKAERNMEPMVMAMASISGGGLPEEQAKRVVHAPLSELVGHALGLQALVDGARPADLAALKEPLATLRHYTVFETTHDDAAWRTAMRPLLDKLAAAFPGL